MIIAHRNSKNRKNTVSSMIWKINRQKHHNHLFNLKRNTGARPVPSSFVVSSHSSFKNSSSAFSAGSFHSLDLNEEFNIVVEKDKVYFAGLSAEDDSDEEEEENNSNDDDEQEEEEEEDNEASDESSDDDDDEDDDDDYGTDSSASFNTLSTNQDEQDGRDIESGFAKDFW
jgi:TATA-binding protein-associated factor Taf7